MGGFEADVQRLTHFLESVHLSAAEQMVDQWDLLDRQSLAHRWGQPEGAIQLYLSSFYNNVGYNYYGKILEARRRRDRAGVEEMALHAERCFEKGFNILDMEAEGAIFFPTESPYAKNFILSFWGLGISKFLLGKMAESEKYFHLCLRMSPEDEQSRAWQAEVSDYLRIMNQQSVELAVRADDVLPTLFNPQLLRVRGELLEWDSYAKPTLEEFAVYVDDDDMDRLEAQGFRNAIALEGHVLVLRSDKTGDLHRPMRIIEVV